MSLSCEESLPEIKRVQQIKEISHLANSAIFTFVMERLIYVLCLFNKNGEFEGKSHALKCGRKPRCEVTKGTLPFHFNKAPDSAPGPKQRAKHVIFQRLCRVLEFCIDEIFKSTKTITLKTFRCNFLDESCVCVASVCVGGASCSSLC